MSFFFRRAAVISTSAAIICFCSCERHRPDELHAEGEHGKAGTGEHAHSGGESGQPHHEHGAQQSRATTAMSVTPAPGNASPTPAEFFPQSTPH